MKKIILPIVLMFSLVFEGVAVTAQTADEIIDKYINAIGGKENWKKINSMVVEGMVEVQGLEIPYKMQVVNNKGMRSDAEFQGNKIIDILTPDKGWSQNPLSGKTTLQPLTSEEMKQ